MPKLFPKFLILNLAFLFFLCGCGDLESELASLTLSPPNSTIGVNQSQLFSVTARDTLGFIVYVVPSWTTSGGVGSINSAGVFTAGSNTGEGFVTATYLTNAATTGVTVTDKGWIQGTVLDSKGIRVPSMKVYVKGYESSLFNFSNSVGFYNISSVPAATYEVWTTETGAYRASSWEVSVDRGKTITRNFTILYFTDPPDLTPPEFTL